MKTVKENDDGLIEIPEPRGKFIIDNANGVMGNDGMYYHFTEVIKLLRLQEDKLTKDKK